MNRPKKAMQPDYNSPALQALNCLGPPNTVIMASNSTSIFLLILYVACSLRVPCTLQGTLRSLSRSSIKSLKGFRISEVISDLEQARQPSNIYCVCFCRSEFSTNVFHPQIFMYFIVSSIRVKRTFISLYLI